MEEFKGLFAVLVYYKHNLQMIHWKATGEGFDRVHSLAEEYYNKFNDFVDSIAEKLLILGENPLSLEECTSYIHDQEYEYVGLAPDAEYGRHEAYVGINHMLKDVINAYNSVLDNLELPKGMKSSLESDLEWLELECDYKTKKRLS